MDFNTIYELIAPYIGTGAIASAIVAIIGIIVKVAKVIKDIRTEFKDTNSEALKAFKQAIPQELYVSIEGLAKTELEKIKAEIVSVINAQCLDQIKENADLMKVIASAFVSMKNIPDDIKLEIAKILELKGVETTESLKVELLPVEKEVAVEVEKSPLISVD